MPEAVLALDTGSPIVSVAVAARGAILASRATRLERSSTQLLGLIDEVLRACALRPADLSGVLALRGPGSFTGLRIALATALGLHQALALPATAVSTFAALAAAAGRAGEPVLAVVDSLRGEWAAQLFPGGDPALPEGEPRLLRAADLAASGARVVTGFDLGPLREPSEPLAAGITFVEAGGLEPGGLAAPAARWFTGLPGSDQEWDGGLLSAPLYARPPAVTPPKAAKSQLRSGAPAGPA